MTTVRTYFNLGRTRFATIARQPEFRGLLAPGDPPARMQAILTVSLKLYAPSHPVRGGSEGALLKQNLKTAAATAGCRGSRLAVPACLPVPLACKKRVLASSSLGKLARIFSGIPFGAKLHYSLR